MINGPRVSESGLLLLHRLPSLVYRKKHWTLKKKTYQKTTLGLVKQEKGYLDFFFDHFTSPLSKLISHSSNWIIQRHFFICRVSCRGGGKIAFIWSLLYVMYIWCHLKDCHFVFKLDYVYYCCLLSYLYAISLDFLPFFVGCIICLPSKKPLLLSPQQLFR